ncbi:MAG: transcription termination factor NusA, partial [Candidatus Pacebacteria bacterium]|nr:transcription termination factor NusA [Candidatus Paceibacterota bacterium]
MEHKQFVLAINQICEEKGISKEKAIEIVEAALASAYKKEYGKKGQVIKVNFDEISGDIKVLQIKTIAEENDDELEDKKLEDDIAKEVTGEERELKKKFNPDKNITIKEAKKYKKDPQLDDEIEIPLPSKSDFGRIAAQTAKQTIIQKIREAERTSIFGEFGSKEGDIISGTVQRIERGNIFVDLGRATGILPYEEQIRSERYKPGERIRAYLYSVEETPKGIFLKLSRTHPQFLHKLFEIEAPEIASGVVEIKEIMREAGSRSKIAVFSNDEHIDPIGSLVGQRGVRVSTIMSELGGEKID